MEAFVDDDVRLVQLFLTDNQIPGPSVYEVGVNYSGKTVCNCPNFKNRNSCKHSKFVQNRLDTDSGLYKMELTEKPTAEDAEKAKRSEKDNRDFIIRFGKVEVV
jgi:glutaredoxin